jgi:hypothetical protein
VGLALLLTMLWTDVVLAAPTPAEKQTARELVFSGRKKRRRGDIDGALEDLKAAHQIMNVPTTGYELGVTQSKAGLLVEALDTLLAVGRMPVGRFEGRAFKKARKDAKKLAEEIQGRIPTVKLSLTGDDADGAEVTIDGDAIPSAAVTAPIKLNPGTHTVVAKGPNGSAAEKTVNAAEGSAVDVTLELDEPKEEAPVEDTSSSDDGATSINPMVYIGFAVGGAGLIAGAVTGALALSKYSDVAPQCPNNRCPPETHEDIDSGETLGTVSTVMFIVGGVGVAVGVVGLFLPLSSDEEAAWLRVSPSSVQVGGRF